MSAELIPCDVAFIAGVEGYQVHEGGVQVLAAATAQELVEHGIALRKENPMAVRIDADIRFGEMDPGSRQALLAGITPPLMTAKRKRVTAISRKRITSVTHHHNFP